jgi:large subunit ribosomal protein L15
MPGFEGGQMPLFRRIPKQGFTNIWGRTEAEVSLASLEKFATALGGVANLETLKKVGAIKGRFDRLVILANGKLEKALVVEAHRVSAAAKNSIEKAGGKVNLIAVPSTGGKKKTKRSTRSAK